MTNPEKHPTDLLFIGTIIVENWQKMPIVESLILTETKCLCTTIT